MSIRRDELQEVKDGLETCEGLSSISHAQREQIAATVEILDGLLGCETCEGFGWYMETHSPTKLIVQLCDHCDAEIESLQNAKNFINSARDAAAKVD